MLPFFYDDFPEYKNKTKYCIFISSFENCIMHVLTLACVKILRLIAFFFAPIYWNERSDTISNSTFIWVRNMSSSQQLIRTHHYSLNCYSHQKLITQHFYTTRNDPSFKNKHFIAVIRHLSRI